MIASHGNGAAGDRRQQGQDLGALARLAAYTDESVLAPNLVFISGADFDNVRQLAEMTGDLLDRLGSLDTDRHAAYLGFVSALQRQAGDGKTPPPQQAEDAVDRPEALIEVNRQRRFTHSASSQPGLRRASGSSIMAATDWPEGI